MEALNKLNESDKLLIMESMKFVIPSNKSKTGIKSFSDETIKWGKSHAVIGEVEGTTKVGWLGKRKTYRAYKLRAITSNDTYVVNADECIELQPEYALIDKNVEEILGEWSVLRTHYKDTLKQTSNDKELKEILDEDPEMKGLTNEIEGTKGTERDKLLSKRARRKEDIHYKWLISAWLPDLKLNAKDLALGSLAQDTMLSGAYEETLQRLKIIMYSCEELASRGYMLEDTSITSIREDVRVDVMKSLEKARRGNSEKEVGGDYVEGEAYSAMDKEALVGVGQLAIYLNKGLSLNPDRPESRELEKWVTRLIEQGYNAYVTEPIPDLGLDRSKEETLQENFFKIFCYAEQLAEKNEFIKWYWESYKGNYKSTDIKLLKDKRPLAKIMIDNNDNGKVNDCLNSLASSVVDRTLILLKDCASKLA